MEMYLKYQHQNVTEIWSEQPTFQAICVFDTNQIDTMPLANLLSISPTLTSQLISKLLENAIPTTWTAISPRQQKVQG